MKKIILSVVAVAALSTQVFGANTAFLSKVMVKMTDDIMALKAKTVYQEEKIMALESQVSQSEKKISVIERQSKANKESAVANKENVAKGIASLEVKLDETKKLNETKTQEELDKLKKELEVAKETSEKASTNSIETASIVNNMSTKDGRVDGLNKRIDGLENTLNNMDTDEEIDPEVEKRILKYINSK